MEIAIHNNTGGPMHVAVHHAGCGTPILRDGLFQCWKQDVQHGQTGVYLPAGFVTDFDKIAAIFGGVAAVAGCVALVVATDGAAAPLAAEGAEAGGAAITAAADDLAADGGVELTALEEEEIAQAAQPSRVAQVARQAGVDVARIKKWVGVANKATAAYAIAAAYTGAAGGFNVYVTPTSQQKDVLGNPTRMWRAEGVVVSNGKRDYVIDPDYRSTGHVWTLWKP